MADTVRIEENVPRLRAVTAHYASNWGSPGDIMTREPLRGLQIAVIEFPPRRERSTFRTATNGMSSYIQVAGSSQFRLELYARSASSLTWVGDLLIGLSRYPVDYGAPLVEFDTIEVGCPIDRSESPYTALLIAPPAPTDPASLGAVPVADPEPLIVQQVIGILDAELGFAMEFGARELWRRLLELEQPPSIDVERASVV